MMDLAPLVPWITAALAAIALLGHAKNFFGSGEKTLGARMEKTEAKLIDHDRRIQAVENEMRHLPNKDTVNKLQVDMTELKGQIASIAKSSDATERATRRVEEFLLRHNTNN